MPTKGLLKDKAINSAGGIAAFRRQSERYNKDLLFLEKCKPDLVKTHDKVWIAIYDNKLVSFNKNLATLLKELKSRGIPEEEALITFISSENILTLYTR
jgi:hypothetical protein